MPNRTAVEWTIKLGLALGCTIADRAIFHRKNYFYPDLPKGYQISQYDEPLCVDGRFTCPARAATSRSGSSARISRRMRRRPSISRVPAAASSARRVARRLQPRRDPLVEIVTQPDLRSADETRRFLQLLRQTIVELGVSDAEMEKGTLRCDANVSVRQMGEEGFRTRWELKNMNSFPFIARGIDAAVREQIALHEAGHEVVQETLRLRR